MGSKEGRDSYIVNILSDLILFFLVMEMLPPQGISDIFPVIQKILWPQVGKYIAIAIIFTGAVIKLIAGRAADLPLAIGLLYPLGAGLATIVQGLDIRPWLRNYSTIIIALGVIQMCKSDFVRLARALKLYLEILVIINFIFVLMYPSGMYETIVYKQNNWLLGYKSSLQCYLMPCMCLEWLDYCYTKRRSWFAIMLAISVAESFLSHNAMLSVGMSVFVLFVVFRLYKKKLFQNAWLYFAMVVSENILLVASSALLFGFLPFRQLLVLFGKNPTLSSRISLVWPRALRMVMDKPIFGHGVYSDDTYTGLLGGGGAVHAHNQMLQVLLDGGIVLLAVFIAWVIFTGYRLSREKDRKSSQVLLVSFFLVFLMAGVEVFIYGVSYFATWLVLFMGMYSKRIDEQYKKYAKDAAGFHVAFITGGVKRKWRFR